MLSPAVQVTTPDGAHPSSSRRRALSYLRNLSQNRSPVGSPTEPSRSPRSYFQRTVSQERKSHSPTPQSRQRSNSKPERPGNPAVGQLQLNQATTVEESASRSGGPPSIAETAEVSTGARQSEEPNSEVTADNASDEMARQRQTGSRRAGSGENSEVQNTTNNTINSGAPVVPARTVSNRAGSGETQEVETTKPQLPMLRLFPHQEIRNGRPSLNFSPVSRTLPSEHSIIRVGRYSEREGIPMANPTAPSDAPVGFKSKVVSRKHCEFSFVDGQWHIKDVASSSGTFLNHIRLSQPNTESRLFPIKDGDIVQLGIDFRGGEEAIFRCVKIRIECNRSWQKKPNNFNKSRHAQLQSLAKDQAAASGTNSGECSICLGSILPCQSLFVAPCAHVWHYKCIRPLLEGKNSTYPQFQCPNCRAYTDLTAEVELAESDLEEWMEKPVDEPMPDQPSTNEPAPPPVSLPAASSNAPPAPASEPEASAVPAESNTVRAPNRPTITLPAAPTPSEILIPPPARSPGPSVHMLVSSPVVTPPEGSEESAAEELPAVTPRLTPTGGGLFARRAAANPASPEIQSMNNIDMPDRADEAELNAHLEQQMTRTETPDPDVMMISGEGPLTPRNDIGPFVFDGSAGRAPSGRRLVVAGAIPEGPEEKS